MLIFQIECWSKANGTDATSSLVHSLCLKLGDNCISQLDCLDVKCQVGAFTTDIFNELGVFD